jgi:hypothetical protein
MGGVEARETGSGIAAEVFLPGLSTLWLRHEGE